jgi:hypothetical protein
VASRSQHESAGSPASSQAALDAVLAGVKLVVRGGNKVELPAQGIDVSFNGAVVATCRHCKVSWEVSTRNFKMLAWWSCPQGCAAKGTSC